jgi:gamma-glutamyltranspeptidase/glutathione hydrolase
MEDSGDSKTAPADLIARAHLDEVMAGYGSSAHQPPTGTMPGEAIAGTGLVVMDEGGSAVACNIGLNNSFGVGRIADHSGILLAAAGGIAGRGSFDFGPMLAINEHSREFRYAAAGGGGPTAPTSLMQVALASVVDGRPLADAVAAKRLHAAAAPDVVFVEPELPASSELERRGHQLREAPTPSRVVAMQCGSGSPNFSRCAVASDPRGNGLALVAGSE